MALQDQVEQKLCQALFSAFYIYFLISEMQKWSPERYNHLLLVTQSVRGELGLEPRPS